LRFDVLFLYGRVFLPHFRKFLVKKGVATGGNMLHYACSFTAMKLITPEAYLERLHTSNVEGAVPYYLFYSRLLDGYVTDPALMQVPFHDHLVHRGDGVFETLKCLNGAVYNLDAHLQRLQRSAHEIGLGFRKGFDVLRQLVLEALETAAQPACSVRIVLSRGPGGMGVAPSESACSALYILIYGAGEPFMRKHPEGATLRKSNIPPKTPSMARIKTCNYLPNALMRAEAMLHGVDCVVGVDEAGHITESATENIGMISKSGRLVFPSPDTILPGTTMFRVAELAQTLEDESLVRGVVFRSIREEELYEAREILIVGTTWNVASVVSYNGQPVGDGKPGPAGRALNEILERDTLENTNLRVRYM
jgi:branched-chain amino acid aminotransferase